MKTTELKVHTTMDMYRWYVAKMLKENPTWFTAYDSLVRRQGIVLLMKRRENGREEIHMSYTLFRSILERNNCKAKDAIIAGRKYNLGQSLGYLLARRVERDFTNPRINVIDTVKYRREHPGDTKTLIYYTDEHYCRIAWHKIGKIRNESVYEFKPAKEFRLSFSRAQFTNPALKYRYLFFPLLAPSA